MPTKYTDVKLVKDSEYKNVGMFAVKGNDNYTPPENLVLQSPVFIIGEDIKPWTKVRLALWKPKTPSDNWPKLSLSCTVIEEEGDAPAAAAGQAGGFDLNNL